MVSPMQSARTTCLKQVSTPVPMPGGAPALDSVPEWMTDYWKHCVEAEARLRLKRKVRGVNTSASGRVPAWRS